MQAEAWFRSDAWPALTSLWEDAHRWPGPPPHPVLVARLAANGFGLELFGASFGFGGGSTASGLGVLVVCGGGLAVSGWLLLAADQGS